MGTFIAAFTEETDEPKTVVLCRNCDLTLDKCKCGSTPHTKAPRPTHTRAELTWAAVNAAWNDSVEQCRKARSTIEEIKQLSDSCRQKVLQLRLKRSV